MQKKKRFSDLILDVSLTDTMYGVVFAYGFNFFDTVKNPEDYLRFFFAYLILVIDWIYTHHTYHKEKYNKELLLLDLGVLFVFSRLLFYSTKNTPEFLLWLSILFGIYIGWDFLSKEAGIKVGFDWLFGLYGDIVAGLVFLGIWICYQTKIINGQYLLWTIIPIIAYGLTLITWFKKRRVSDVSESDSSVQK